MSPAPLRGEINRFPAFHSHHSKRQSKKISKSICKLHYRSFFSIFLFLRGCASLLRKNITPAIAPVSLEAGAVFAGASGCQKSREPISGMQGRAAGPSFLFVSPGLAGRTERFFEASAW